MVHTFPVWKIMLKSCFHNPSAWCQVEFSRLFEFVLVFRPDRSINLSCVRIYFGCLLEVDGYLWFLVFYVVLKTFDLSSPKGTNIDNELQTRKFATKKKEPLQIFCSLKPVETFVKKNMYSAVAAHLQSFIV